MTEEPIHLRSPPADKIALFRSLFRGRDDVYSRRFESRKTGRSGYQPACANEWVRDLCDKPAVKCGACPNRRLLPLTDAVVGWHLSGRDETGRECVIGLYPMLLDETCFCLAVDFDKENWQEDATAYLDTCRRIGLPVALERSRSGNGGHAWLFFDEAVPAVLARKLASHLLTVTMERRPEVGLDSYDRFIPNQDTLPGGGFGSLIAMPLQHRPRQSGNSLFLDEQCTPHEDQWAYLSTVRRISRSEILEIVTGAEKRNLVIGVRVPQGDEGDSITSSAPWVLPPSRKVKAPPLSDLPETLEVVLGDQVYVSRDALTPGLRNRILRLAAFQNPEFYRKQAQRLPTYDTPRVIACAKDYPQRIGLPRGCLEDLQQLLSELKIGDRIRDERFGGRPLDVAFQGALRPEQEAAAEAMIARDTGVLAATTAFGKTVVAAWLIAERGVNTLVLVHRRQLQEQWIESLSAFLGLPAKAIGRIGGGRKKPTGMLDVALIQSMVRKGIVDDRVRDYGQIIVDECHHLPAKSFELVARRATAKFICGLSATVHRKDGHEPIIFMHCGPIRHRVNAREQARARPFAHRVIVRPTGFRVRETANPGTRLRFHELYAELVADKARNRLICEDVLQAVRDSRTPLVLTERTQHLEHLAETLSAEINQLIVLRGGMRRKELVAARALLATARDAAGGAGDEGDETGDADDRETRVILATGRYIGEGFDDARLDTLFLTLPVSWRGTIAQYAGRLHRLHGGKREVRIYDYADLEVPTLARMFDRRCRGYEAVGYTIVLPASAAPGWPADVPLPAGERWKKDYAASVRRLIRDGVDSPLANLFVQASRPLDPGAEGVARARSSSEAFLFRRLETLPETSGKFCLNVALPITFGGRSAMEVDLLCAEAHLAVEVDGDQHLADPEAYRRDRRKDALLQENGYFVLRFLARDLGKHLDQVLDTILRTLVNRGSGL